MTDIEKIKLSDDMVERAVAVAAQAAPDLLDRYFKLKEAELKIKREKQQLEHEQKMWQIRCGHPVY